MSNYNATIVKIDNISKHPNADRLQITNIFGNTVIVGTDTKIGDIGVFFPLESQVGLEFAQANDLIRRKDASGKVLGGLFDENRRVRAQKLRGIPSMGFFAPLYYLSFLGFENINISVGDSFESLNGFIISTKYIPKTNKKVSSGQFGTSKKESRVICFPEHIDTEHFFRKLTTIPKGKTLIITTKLHGTSLRAGYVPVKRTLSLIERFLKFIGVTIKEIEYDYVYGSRRVIKDKNNPNHNHFFSSDLWTQVGEEQFKNKLHKGEIVYAEVLGYVPNSSEMIQDGFTYGCEKRQYDVYIYRIAKVNEDGNLIDYSWDAVVDRCGELGIKCVPEEARIILKYRSANEFIDKFKQTFLEKPCRWDSRVPEEGVCIRIEGMYPSIYKAKSFSFLEWETAQLDTNKIDIETNES